MIQSHITVELERLSVRSSIPTPAASLFKRTFINDRPNFFILKYKQKKTALHIFEINVC